MFKCLPPAMMAALGLLAFVTSTAECAVSGGTGTGLSATYYPNDGLTESPVLVRIDPQINFDWGIGSPSPAVPVDGFSARWLGSIQPLNTEALTLIARTDDGVRLWLNGVLVIDSWISRSAADSTYTFAATAGQKYTVRMEYFENTGFASAQLSWQSTSIVRQPIPSTQLYPETAVTAAIPTSSIVSPAFIQGVNPRGVTPTIASNFRSVTPMPLSDIDFYANLPLSPLGFGLVFIGGGTTNELGLIKWTQTKVDGAQSPIVSIRVGDSLLVESDQGKTIEVSFQCGAPVIYPVLDGIPRPVQFSQAGSYTITSRSAIHEALGTVAVQVVTLNVDPSLIGSQIKSEVAFTRTFDVPVLPLSASSAVVFGTTMPAGVTVVTGPTTADGTTLSVTPNSPGPTTVIARLGQGGPIIATAKTIGFAINRTDLQSLNVDHTDSQFRSICYQKLILRPYVPGLGMSFSLFAHTSTFLGGAHSFTVETTSGNTSLGEPGFSTEIDPATNETIGVLNFTLILPFGENSSCFHLDISQNQ